MEKDRCRVWHFALTGGPCAGKTTALSYLTEKFSESGFRVVVVPEAATLLIQAGVAPWTVGINSFQRRVFELITAMEDNLVKASVDFKEDKIIFIHDRGIPDGRAYVPREEFSLMLSEYGTDLVSVCDRRYDAVFHLRTAALGAEKFYTVTNNIARRESLEEARALDERTLSAWVGHPHLRILGNEQGFEKKMRRLHREMCAVLGIPVPIEIERTFLMEPLDISAHVPIYQSVDIEQMYLMNTKPNEELRVRKRGRDGAFAFYRTVKYVIGDGERVEIEYQIGDSEYRWSTQFQLPGTRIIRKTRTCFVYGDQYFEYDRFLDPPGIHKLEIELTDRNDSLVLPDFIRVIREVTGEKAYTNAELAKIS